MKLKLPLILAALFISANLLGQDSIRTVDRLVSLSERLRVSNTDSALQYATQALEIAQANHNTLQIIQSEFALGSAYYSQNNYEKSLQHLEKSMQLARSNNQNSWVALNLNRIGNVYQLKSKYDLALNSYNQALTIHKQNNDKPQIARALVNVGSVYGLTGNYTNAIELMFEALKIFEATPDHEGIAWTSLSISRLFNRLGITDKALTYAESALNQYKAIDNQNGVILSLTELSNIYYRAELHSKALLTVKQVMDENLLSGNLYGKAANYLLMGVIYYKMDSLPLSLENLEQARQLKIMLNDSIDLAKLNLYLGNVYRNLFSEKLALQSYNKALQIAKHQHLMAEKSDIYLNLSEIYTNQKNYKLALEYYQQYSAVRDSLNSNDISRLEMQYDFEKRESKREIISKQKDEKLKRQRIYSISISAAFIISICFAIAIYKFLKVIRKQRDFANYQQKQITDSITYASRIQKAIFPRPDLLTQFLHEHFILFRPRSIVSGDFYWIAPLSEGKFAIAVADCTGHGVPGSLMSILGMTLLNELLPNNQESAGNILSHLRSAVISTLHQTGNLGDSQDGMDMALVLVDQTKHIIQFAGAYLPMLVVRPSAQPRIECANQAESKNDYTVYEIKGNKMPIGYHPTGEKAFVSKTFEYLPSDSFYLLSDGFTDQFAYGGSGAKYSLANFKSLLLNIQTQSMNEQRESLNCSFEAFKGPDRQIDDVIVLGFKLA